MPTAEMLGPGDAAELRERWTPEPDAEPVDTFTIITTTPHKVAAAVHNRVRVILAEQDYERWLDRNVKGVDVAGLLKPFPPEPMEADTVSTAVNSVRNKGPELIDRV